MTSPEPAPLRPVPTAGTGGAPIDAAPLEPVATVGIPTLAVSTREVDDVGELMGVLRPAAPEETFSWVRRGEGLVGAGVAWRLDTSGPDRMARADAAWREVVARADVRDEVRLAGTGLVALGSFAFHDDSPAGGSLVVPRVIVGRRAGRCWVTLVEPLDGPRPAGAGAGRRRATAEAAEVAAVHARWAAEHTHAAAATVSPDSPGEPGQVWERDGALTPGEWTDVVARVLERIDAGEVAKVVLSRDVLATTEFPVDVRRMLGRLADHYPTCWTFSVDGLVGATPELLVRRDRGLAACRVLAGTVQRTGDERDDLRVASALASSSKDLDEHEFAVASLVDALAPYCASMNVPDSPFVLRLPNVMHLASDVTGAVRPPTNGDPTPSSLTLAAALHPTAAVGGTPTRAAVRILARAEGADRGRYAGPVGWIAADGDGEWGIGLRSGAVLDPHTVRMHAGCGIVAGSVPAEELAESEAKLEPLRHSLRP